MKWYQSHINVDDCYSYNDYNDTENEIAYGDIPFERDGANLRPLSDIDDERAHFISCVT